MSPTADHYATLGLDRRCTNAEIRAAYRALAKRLHPDRNPHAAEALQRAQELNAAHEVLRDPARRRAYDQELELDETEPKPARLSRKVPDLRQDVRLRIEDFFRGTSLDVRIREPGGDEIYRLEVPPGTAPGTKFVVHRDDPPGGLVRVRVCAMPSARFKVRGSDLRCDLRISAQRASVGGTEFFPGPAGAMLRVTVPAGTARGEVVRLAGEGLPKPRGGRGDLQVRIDYRPEVRIVRSTRK